MLVFVLPRTVQASADGNREQGLSFPDSNFVIVFKDHQVFRVHKSTIELQAPQIVRKSTSRDEVYSYALLEDVDGAQVDSFLRAAFCPEYFPAPPQRVDFKVIRMVLMMAHKFGAIPFRRRALAHLEASANSALSQSSAKIATLMFVISCAREVDALWLMSPLLYALSCVPPRTLAVTGPADEYLYMLSNEDHRIISEGRVSTRNFSEIELLFFVDLHCIDYVCIRDRRALLEGIRGGYDQDPFYAMNTLWCICQSDAENVSKVCSGCRETIMYKLEK